MEDQEHYTEEQIQKHITNSFYSWDICENLSSQSSLTEEEQDRLNKNKEHIQIMYSKEWFKNGCSNEQASKLEKYI